jgi:heme/copper-type cytochrome/quinol oxidase subunit 3
MTDTRRSVDVEELPSVAFGHRSELWWGTAAFMVIETTTLAALVSSYFYLARNSVSWPPAGTPPPDLFWGTLVVILLVLAVIPKQRAIVVARRFDARSTIAWMVVSLALTTSAALLRIWEFGALNVRWDNHAYGSVVWALLAFNSLLLAVDIPEEGLIATYLASRHREKKHFSDAEDSSFYQYFLSIASIITYLTIYIAPRVLP